MNRLSLREKIGQLIVAGFPATHLTDEFRNLIREYRIGNVILFSRNVDNAAQLRALCDELRDVIRTETGAPPLIAIDQEGGRVIRLPDDAANMPGAMAVAATRMPELAYAAGRITARELRALGINWNLAPVLDINNNPQNPVINVRSYGDTAETVERYGLQTLKGLQDEGVLAAVKHFPGHGDTNVDSHLGLPVIDKSRDDLMQLELKPFRQAIQSGAECVMSSHILFPAIEKERLPATMSRTILTDLLKRELGYEGLIVTDCLEMDAIRRYYGTAQGALGALKAGAHLICISHTSSLVKEAVELVEAAVLSGELPEAELDEAVNNVLRFKRKYGDPPQGDLSVVGCEAHRRLAAEISLSSICRVGRELEPVESGGEPCIFIGCPPYRTDQASNQVKQGLSFPEAMGQAFGMEYLACGIDPDAEEREQIAAKAQNYPRVVIGLYNGVDNPGQLLLANRLIAEGRKVTAVSLGKPYDLGRLEGEFCGLAAFEYTSQSLASLVRVLSGAAKPTGTIPVAWKV